MFAALGGVAVAPSRPAREEPVAWSAYRPDGMLADMLAEEPAVAPPAAMRPDDVCFEILERIGAWEKVIAWAQAKQQEEMARFLDHATAHQPDLVDADRVRVSAAAELGLMLRVSRRTAEMRLDIAVDLVQRLPEVHVSLCEGWLGLPAARVLADETVHLPDSEARSVATGILAEAPWHTPGQLRVATRRAVQRADPDAVRRRCERAARERGVWLQDEADGMASLHARLTAADAVGCYAVLDECARRAAGPGAPGIDARRGDALVDLVCGVDPGRINVQVRVTVSSATLLGATEEPGELAGYGPIPADQARRLAADGTWRRILTDPATGALLDFGTTRYRPPPQLAELVITRDQTCRHPGCRIPAHRCDLDHIVPFDQINNSGPTSDANLAPLCRAHHQLKQQPGWAIARSTDGTVTWHTPSGHTYQSRPPPQC